MQTQKLNIDNLEQLDIEAGLLESADAVRDFLVNKFGDVLGN